MHDLWTLPLVTLSTAMPSTCENFPDIRIYEHQPGPMNGLRPSRAKGYIRSYMAFIDLACFTELIDQETAN